MFFPLYDDNSDRQITPWVTYILVALNVFVFVVIQQGGANQDIVLEYGQVPEEIITGSDVAVSSVTVEDPITGEKVETETGPKRTPIPVYLTLLTSMFLHGSWLHLFGNMLFLWIFGDNVEDKLGHFRYTIFYLLAGLGGSFAHIGLTVWAGQNTLVPCIGASGAISGVLAAYAFLHPKKNVVVLIVRFLTTMPAWIVIGVWFAFQLINSIVAFQRSGSGGVAYGAHVGGFVAGVVLLFLLIPYQRSGAIERPNFLTRKRP